MQKICGNCFHFLLDLSTDGTKPEEGLCRRYPPTPLFVELQNECIYRFPRMTIRGLCGEFKERTILDQQGVV
jgi:hypothetical protein